MPFKPNVASKAITFHRSSSESLDFQAFIFVPLTPSDTRQNHWESENSFMKSPLRKSRAPALTGFPSLPWQLAQFTSIFSAPVKIAFPCSIISGLFQ